LSVRWLDRAKVSYSMTRAKANIKRALSAHWPIVAGLALLWLLVAVEIARALRLTDGYFAYPLDDTYIEIATARNLVLFHTWGVTSHGFSSSCSSLVWPVLLAIVNRVVGVSELTPLVLNLVVASALCVVVYLLLKKASLTRLELFFALVALIFFTPLPTLILAGQEHILHSLATILFLYLAAQVFDEEERHSFKDLSLIATAPILTSARYEGLFLLSVVCALLFLKKRFAFSLGLLAAGLLPIVVYGIFSLHRGWYFLPNSVLLKGATPGLSSVGQFFANPIQNLRLAPHMEWVILIPFGALILKLRYSSVDARWDGTSLMLLSFIAAALLHLQFAMVGYQFRYEAYLIAAGIYLLCSLRHQKWCEELLLDARHLLGDLSAGWAVIVLVVACAPFALRGFVAFVKTPRAVRNIYQQQCMMGLFLQRFYSGSAVALNDIGAADYYADLRLTDLKGLASMDVARAIRGAGLSRQAISEISAQDHVRIAVVYTSWFPGGLPEDWIRVGQWKIGGNVVNWDDTVTFFGTDRSEAELLRANLVQFRSELPAGIRWTELTQR
jgi:hypothetical protein